MIEKTSTISAAQMRAARAYLRWSAGELAERSGLGIATVQRAESAEGTPSLTRANAEAVRRALEAAGVRFAPAGTVFSRDGTLETSSAMLRHVQWCQDEIERLTVELADLEGGTVVYRRRGADGVWQDLVPREKDHLRATIAELQTQIATHTVTVAAE